MLSIGMTYSKDVQERDVVLVLDVSRAHFHAPVRREIYTKLCKEDFEEGKCAKLLATMYGCRDAGGNFEEFLRGVMVDKVGMKVGQASPCIFVDPERRCRSFVHGDDIILVMGLCTLYHEMLGSNTMSQ